MESSTPPNLSCRPIARATAPSSASSGGNGLYAYGSASAFPTSSYNATNYYVDVIFNGSLAS